MEQENGRMGKWNKFAVLLPLLLTAVVYVPTSGFRAVIDYDEGHYSQVALQMLARGDWITPYDDGVRFLEKPPLMYWLTATSLWAFGINEFALRLPSALGVILMVWIVMLTARHAAGERAAIISGLCVAFCVGTYLFTREALHDIWLVLFLALAMFAFLRWYRNPSHPLRHALLFAFACAGAVMTKSLVGLAFPVGVVVLFFLLKRERPEWRSLHILPVSLVFLSLAAPWHWLAAVRNQGVLWSFFVNEQFLRFVGRHDPPVVWSVPLATFWLLNLVWFFPWTAFLPAAVVDLRKPMDADRGDLARLAVSWAVVILVFFSVSGRLEHYFFPAIPALALPIGLVLSRTEENRATTWGFRTLALLGLAALAAGLAFAVWLSASGHGFKTGQAERTEVISSTDFSILEEMPATIQAQLLKPAIVTILSMAAGFLAALQFEKRRRRMQAILCLTAVMAVICGLTQWSMVICEGMISSRSFGLAVAQEAAPGDHLVIMGDYESANSISFYQPLHIEVTDGVAYSLIPGMKYPDAPRIVLSHEEFASLWEGHDRVFVLVPASRRRDLRPAGIEVLQVLDRVLLRNR
jgi:hypothetical protein